MLCWCAPMAAIATVASTSNPLSDALASGNSSLGKDVQGRIKVSLAKLCSVPGVIFFFESCQRNIAVRLSHSEHFCSQMLFKPQLLFLVF